MASIMHSSQLTAHSSQLTVNFLCHWAENRLTSWSGIHCSLFTALSELANTRDFPLLDSTASRILLKGRRVVDRLTRSDDFMLFFSKLCERQIRRLKLSKNVPCLMFTEFLTQYTPNSYLYQDLTVDYIFRMREVSSSLSKYTPLPPRVSPEKARIRREHTMQVNRTCAGLFTMSEYLARDIVQNSGISASRVHHVGGGCNIDTSLIHASGRNNRRFFFSGRDWERKNGPLVVEAFRRLRKKYSDAELYIAGPSAEPQEARGVDGIKFLGLVSYEESAKYFNLCDFFVMPSRFEAYGIVFPEALIFGLPCIGKNICAMPEFIHDGENGRLIHDDDPDELAECMESLLVDAEAFKARVAAKHEDYLKAYSWRTVAERIVKVMREDGF